MQLLYVTLLKINFPQNLSNLMKHAWSSAAAAAEPARWHPPGSGTQCRGSPRAVCPLCWAHSALGQSTSAQHPIAAGSTPLLTPGTAALLVTSSASSRSRGSASPISVTKNHPSPGNQHPPSLGARHPSSLGIQHPPSPEAKHSSSPGAKHSPSLGNQHPTLRRYSILLSSSQGAQHPHRTVPGAAARTESAARSVLGHRDRKSVV